MLTYRSVAFRCIDAIFPDSALILCPAGVLTEAVQKDLGKALPFEVTASEINLGACLVPENLFSYILLFSSSSSASLKLHCRPLSLANSDFRCSSDRDRGDSQVRRPQLLPRS